MHEFNKLNMRVNTHKGQISVYLCIIFLSVLAAAAILVDISRVSSGDALVKKAVRSAARSSLAEYSTKMKENYGIFALSPEKSDELRKNVEKYIELNLVPPEKTGDLKLYDFKIEQLKVTPMFNLSEDEVVRQQILEYMKFRAPEQMIDGFVERLQIFKDTGKMSEAYKKKVAVDKLAGNMDKCQQKLKKSIDGTGTTGEKCINGFNKGGCLNSAFKSFLDIKAKYGSYLSEISSIESAVSQAWKELQELDNPAGKTGNDDGAASAAGDDAGNAGSKNGVNKDDKKDDKRKEEEKRKELEKKREAERKSIYDRINSLNDEKDRVSRLAEDARSGMSSLLNTMRFDMTEPYIGLNEAAVESVKGIVEAGEKITSAASELEVFLNSNFGVSNPMLSEFLKTATDDMAKLKKLLLSGEKANAMISGFTSNAGKLKGLSAQLQSLASLTNNAEGFESTSAGIMSLISEYDNRISYEYEKPQKGEKSNDPRNGKAEAVKQFLEEKILKDRNFLGSGIKEDELPSKLKVRSPDFDKEDAPYLYKGGNGTSQANSIQNGKSHADNTEAGEMQKIKQPAAANPSVNGGNTSNAGEKGNFGSDVDLYNEDGTFQENSFGAIGNMGAMLAENMKSLRDELYINEYIMGSFRTAVPQTGEGAASGQDYDLRGKSKQRRDTFYDCEVEYILHGSPSQNENKIFVEGQLLLVRFGLDTLHVYTDGKKKALANATAAAVAGWWTGGAGIPVISNLIMAGWGLGEAIIDVHDLMDGKKVPIYKSSGDWKLDIGLSKEGPKTDSRLAFSYNDYLRLFLLASDSKSKLGRMEDLIQLNMGKGESDFKMSDCGTYIRVEATVSMKYLFATRAFMPGDMKTGNGRHLIKVLVYEGY